MKFETFKFANGRLLAVGSSKRSVRVKVMVGEYVGNAFISISNFLYMLTNPDANFEIDTVPERYVGKMQPNGEIREMYFPETKWISVYKPSRF